MHKVVLSINRKVCLLITLYCAAWLTGYAFKRTEWYRNHLYHQLVKGDADQQLRAASALVQVGGQKQLLNGLKAEEESVRTVARKALEFMWFNAAGHKAYQLTEQAYRAAEKAEFEKALALLNGLVEKYPKFAEAYNRRAAVYWEMGEYRKSIADSEHALKLNPNHYGAWQGIGVCRLKMGDVVEACRCLRAALKILPYDTVTRKSLERCEELLREHSPGKEEAVQNVDII